jgi:hypothetical protein
MPAGVFLAGGKVADFNRPRRTIECVGLQRKLMAVDQRAVLEQHKLPGEPGPVDRERACNGLPIEVEDNGQRVLRVSSIDAFDGKPAALRL